MKDEEELKGVFAELIREKLHLFRQISYRIVNSYADADDAVQSALVKAWRKRSSFRGDFTALAGWVARITVTESYDILRRRQREQRKKQTAEILETGEDSREQLEALERAIAGLPELYRNTVHLGILSGLSGAEAAQALGCSVNTLYQRIHKAKKLLLSSMRRLDDE